MQNPTASRYVLPGLAVSSLYSYPVWQEARAGLSPYSSYFRNHGPNSMMIVAAVLHTLIIAIFLYAAAALVIRLRPGAARVLDGLFVCASLALFLLAIPSIASNWVVGLILGLPLFSVSICCLSLPKFQRPFISAGYAVICSLALLPAILTADLVGLFARRCSIQDGSFSQQRTGGIAARRLIWVVLDEFDTGIAVTSRPAGLKLPVLDRLLATSVTGADVDPAGPWTREVIPAYLTGRRVSKVEPDGASGLRIWYTNGGESALSREKTIFDRAKERGVRSAATAWYNPICRWLGRDSLEECTWAPNADALLSLRRETTGERLGLAWALKLSFVSAATLGKSSTNEEYHIAREQHLEAFKTLHASSLRQVANPSLGFLFLHYNIPHPLGIYDSRRGVLSASESSTYLDNLVLTDRVLGDLLETAGRQGGLEHTAFLITSDHAFRPEVWNYRDTWSLEAPEVRSHPKQTRVLFLFHNPGDSTRQVVKEKLNAISGHDLSLAWLDATLDGHEAVASWLRQDKSAAR